MKINLLFRLLQQFWDALNRDTDIDMCLQSLTEVFRLSIKIHSLNTLMPLIITSLIQGYLGSLLQVLGPIQEN